MPGSGNSGLDTGQLDCLVRSYFVKGLAPSTLKAYGRLRYLNFYVTAELPAVPAGEDVLCKFAAALATEGLRHRTIKSYMAGVRYLHIEEGLGDPFLQSPPHLHYVLRGVKHSQVVREWLGESVCLSPPTCYARSRRSGMSMQLTQIISCCGLHVVWPSLPSRGRVS